MIRSKSKFDPDPEIISKIDEQLVAEGLILTSKELRQFRANFKAASEKGSNFEKSFQQALDNLKTVLILMEDLLSE